MPCYICGNQKHNRSFVVREMQMGLREEFPYFECSACGCLQLARVPDDLSPYYPSNYFSHRIVSNDDTSAREPLKARVIRSLLTRHFFFRRSLVTGWVARRSCIVEEYPQWVQRQHLDLKLRTTARVLDVGSGRGKLLMELRHNGFTALCGIDPFIEGDLTFSDGVRVFKRHLHEMTGEFDLIMLHHSFEHMAEPLAVLQQLHRLVTPGHHVLVRIPVAGSYAWRKYGVDWASLDAPRHLFLHTRTSMEILASRAGFEIVDQFFDGDGFGLWASELYRRDIPLMDGDASFFSQAEKTFTPVEMEAFRDFDAELNATGQADCSGFYLRKL